MKYSCILMSNFLFPYKCITSSRTSFFIIKLRAILEYYYPLKKLGNIAAFVVYSSFLVNTTTLSTWLVCGKRSTG